jgi:hypothetical protein
MDFRYEKKISPATKWLINGRNPGCFYLAQSGPGKHLARAIMRTINYLYYSVYRISVKK